MKAILMSHYDVLDRRPHYLPRLRFNLRHLEPRAVHLATLYSHGILADLNGVLGCPWPRECFDQFDWFDGLAFQKSYFAMKEEQKLGRHGISWRNFFCSKSQHVQDEIEGILQLLLSRFPSNGAEGKVPRAKKSFPVAEQGAAGTDRADLDGDEKENKEKGSAKRRKRKGSVSGSDFNQVSAPKVNNASRSPFSLFPVGIQHQS